LGYLLPFLGLMGLAQANACPSPVLIDEFDASGFKGSANA
jgi:hypothetical protein